MPFRITEKDSFLQIDWTGILNTEDLVNIRQEIPGHMMKNRRLVNVLHTFDTVTDCAFSPIEVYNHSLKIKAAHIPMRSKSASVATNETAFKYAKLFQELNRHPNLEMEIFGSEKEALAWLGA